LRGKQKPASLGDRERVARYFQVNAKSPFIARIKITPVKEG
jgi:hypothetical protein